MSEPLIAWKPEHVSAWTGSTLHTIHVSEYLPKAPRPPTHYPIPSWASRIISETAITHRLALEALTQPSADPAVRRARIDCARVLRQQVTMDGKHRFSFPHIAALLNFRDHTAARRAVLMDIKRIGGML